MPHTTIQPWEHARRRIGGLAYITDEHGFVLLVEPVRRPGWYRLPGGYALHDEPAHMAAMRELREELCLTIPLTTLLAIDYTCRNPRTGDLEGYHHVFDGGMLTSEEIDQIVLRSEEVSAHRWFPLDVLGPYVEDRHLRRILAAARARENGRGAVYLVHGKPVNANAPM
ncbi:NUDIX domain-containing protein [Allostreptomyces psammosilenae]|uniref:ADP-ribose pyrophosphatase YjhB (NUDIX family) n=1 Tax=Allostreptomyces psammosilenae TaxID=1892865 RepID=A0A852ZV55_9ACTN|nr:NUDIX hydrolase [Allostreptomyces psammosilenae]NYI05805.1 ADP-ribose pyrophosphatase YjhB (NUDIX family) [Allostreptomyces psammosilenae]